MNMTGQRKKDNDRRAWRCHDCGKIWPFTGERPRWRVIESTKSTEYYAVADVPLCRDCFRKYVDREEAAVWNRRLVRALSDEDLENAQWATEEER